MRTRFMTLVGAVLIAALLASCSAPRLLQGSWQVTFQNETNDTSSELVLELMQPNGEIVRGDAYLDDSTVGWVEGTVTETAYRLVVNFSEQLDASSLTMEGVIDGDELSGTYESSGTGRGTVEGLRLF